MTTTHDIPWGPHSISSETNGTPNDEANVATYMASEDGGDDFSETSDDCNEDSNNDPDEVGRDNVADDPTKSGSNDAGPEESSEDHNSYAEDSELVIDDSNDVSAECSNDDENCGSSDRGSDARTGPTDTQPPSLQSHSQDEGSRG